MIHAGYKGSIKNTLHAKADFMKKRLKIFILDMNI